MTDHTPEPWRTDDMPEAPSGWYMQLGREDWLRAKACVNACAGIPTEQLEDYWTKVVSTLTEQNWDRLAACANACAGIPTEELGDVKALVEAAAKAPQYIAVCQQEEADAGRSVTEKMAGRDLQALALALHPFLRKDGGCLEDPQRDDWEGE